MDMLGLYKAVSGIISEAVVREGWFPTRCLGHTSVLTGRTFRAYRAEDRKSSELAGSQERNSQTRRDVHQEGGGFRSSEY
jgi:hypothetical protein